MFFPPFLGLFLFPVSNLFQELHIGVLFDAQGLGILEKEEAPAEEAKEKKKGVSDVSAGRRGRNHETGASGSAP